LKKAVKRIFLKSIGRWIWITINGIPFTTQARSPPTAELMETRPYTPGMGRPISKPRPLQGARLAALRKAAGLSQGELARALGVPQSSIGYWETASKPPRSDILPKLAKLLGVRVEELLGTSPVVPVGRPGPVGKLQRAFEQATSLPRRQQQLVLEFVSTLVQRHKKAS
jgi:transcriptional regulator with XRE-family HTH domain